MKRLNIYTEIAHTGAVDEIIVKIIVELLSTLAVVTKQVKQNRTSKPDLLLICYSQLNLNTTQLYSQRSFWERNK